MSTTPGDNPRLSEAGIFHAALIPQDLDNPLWRYACEQYQHPKVKQACLDLQDFFGADVNVLLTAGWAASLGLEPDWPSVLFQVSAWQTTIVTPLRSVRQQLDKSSPLQQQLRASLTKLEIDAEQIEVAYLHTYVSKTSAKAQESHHDPSVLCLKNITSYLMLLTSTPDDQAILQAAETLKHHLCNKPE